MIPRPARVRASIVLCLALGAALSAGAASAEAPEADRFDVWEYRIEGNARLPVEDVERAVYPWLGPQRTIDDVQAARRSLEQAYRDRGFGAVLVDIPEQDVAEGVIRLAVVEATVSRLRVTGSRYFSLGRIKSKVPSLAEGETPFLPAVQKEIAALNRASADRQVTPVLRPGRTPGSVEVDLKVKDSLPLHGSVDLNDEYTPDTERLRLATSLRYDNLWQKEHSLGLAWQVTPQDPSQLQVVSATYLARIPDSDTVVTLYGVRSETDIATSLGSLSVLGAGTIAGVRATVPLPPGERLFHSLTLGADYKDFGESLLLAGSDTSDTPISYLVFSADYGGSWLGDRASTEFRIGGVFGPRGLGNTEKEFGGAVLGIDAATGELLIGGGKRIGAGPNFAYLTADLTHARQFAFATSLRWRVTGQLANDPLISNEQFSVGGAGTVRGYLATEELADDGLATSLEWWTPSLPKTAWAGLQRLQALVFVDAAKTRVQHPLPGESEGAFLWGAGVGVEAEALDHLSATVFWAVPLRDGGTTEAGESRVHFRLGYEF